MRNFSSGIPTKLESPLVFNLKRHFWLFGPLLLIILIAVAGIALALLFHRPADLPERDISQPSQKSTRSTLSLLNESYLMDAYIEASALGGRDAIESIRSIRSSGKILWEDQTVDCTLTKRRPDLVLLELKDADAKITYGYDGRSFWHMSELPGATATEHEAPERAEEAFHEMARFFDPLLKYILEGGGILQVIELDEYAGATALRVQMRNLESNRLDIYLDTDSLEILAMIEHLPARGEKRTTRYQDYRRINGVRVPFHIKVSTADEVLYQLQLSTWQSNTGVMSPLFSPPADLSVGNF